MRELSGESRKSDTRTRRPFPKERHVSSAVKGTQPGSHKLLIQQSAVEGGRIGTTLARDRVAHADGSDVQPWRGAGGGETTMRVKTNLKAGGKDTGKIWGSGQP